MLSKKEEDYHSKFLSYVLRHNPAEIDLILDENGWASVAELLEKSKSKEHVLSFDMLEQVVTNNDKQRFAFNEDKTRIRANQGHTVQVDLALDYVAPPDVLYHGTVGKNLNSILEQGLKPMKRHDVHLSFNALNAKNVAMRYGKPVILKVNSAKMHKDGLLFKCTKNNVWLTAHVAPQYIEVIE